MPKRLTVKAPAKVNLHLAVGDIRPDGYHEVETVLQALDLSDTLTIESSDSLELVCGADLGIPSTENLVWRAAEELAAALDRSADLKITLSKEIPSGAGLGGGSSDAAALLAGAAHLWDVAPDDPLLYRVAASLGADVPFFLRGGTAVYGGRGDEYLGPLKTVGMWIALIKPPLGIPTAQAYSSFDSLARNDISLPPSATQMIRACESGEPQRVADSLFNNMTTAAISIEPLIEEAIAWVGEFEGVLGSLMSGSGSAVFGICKDRSAAENVAAAALAEGWWGAATRTRTTGVSAASMEGDR